jgi:hypothetical protein
MNLLFFVERLEDAHVAQALTLSLRDRLNITSVSAVTFRQAPEGNYLLQETNGLFNKVLSQTTMHTSAAHVKPSQAFLDTLESRYGLPFWHYVTGNRFLSLTRFSGTLRCITFNTSSS